MTPEPVCAKCGAPATRLAYAPAYQVALPFCKRHDPAPPERRQP